MSLASPASLQDLQRRLLQRAPWLRWLKPPSATLNTGKLLQRVVEMRPPLAYRVLDLGCGSRRLPGALRCDLVMSPPGIRADAALLPFGTGTLDCVIATAVLEHVPAPTRVVAEIHRVLKPEGIVFLEVPFLEGFHADPDDYQRFTLRGLEVLLCGFDILEYEVCAGPSSALSWMLREYPGTWFRTPQLALLAKFVAAWLTVPIKYLDYFTAHRPLASRIAAGFGVIARRSR